MEKVSWEEGYVGRGGRSNVDGGRRMMGGKGEVRRDGVRPVGR